MWTFSLTANAFACGIALMPLVSLGGCSPSFRYVSESYDCPKTLLENVQKTLTEVKELCPSPLSSPQRLMPQLAPPAKL